MIPARARGKGPNHGALAFLFHPAPRPGSRDLWLFSADKFHLQREEHRPPDQSFPAKLVTKDWPHLVQPRLNVAWLPADEVFLRVIQLPPSDPAEILSMVELQLEKLSPLPAAQIVWSFETLPMPSARCRP